MTITRIRVEYTVCPEHSGWPGVLTGSQELLLAIVLNEVSLYDGDVYHSKVIIEKPRATSQLLGDLKWGRGPNYYLKCESWVHTPLTASAIRSGLDIEIFTLQCCKNLIYF